ncbi:uncharacterized protein LOC134836968 [Culicoides brevitarsis]|uniref:uncharacterized protein LOC134836968 n=1 Tax=Culicoides brevitarsis TaxID=469753 RepID=UPI00307C6AAF
MKYLLSDEEVLIIVKNATKSENITNVRWILKQKEGELTGFLGSYHKLRVDASIDSKPETLNFFVKTLPDGSEQREFIERTNLFLKEAVIYSDMLDRMPDLKSVPRSYYYRKDILVLDDLALKGYSLMPARANFPQSHVQLVLKALAEMHAACFHFEEEILKDSLENVFKEPLSEVMFISDNIWLTMGFDTIKKIALEKSKYAKDSKICKLIEENFLREINKIFELLNETPEKYKKVICHRDIWRNNLMFKFDNDGNPQDCILVDFQQVRYMPPAADVLFALHCLQRMNDRKKYYLENLKFYHECLTSSLQKYHLNVDKFLSFGNLVDSCEHYRLFGALIKAIYIQTTYFPTEEMAKLRNDGDNYRKFITEDRSILLTFIETDKVFRDWMLEAVEELVEMLIIPRWL